MAEPEAGHETWARLLDAAWPAVRVEERHGWLLRHADGFSSRANSVWPRGEPADPGAAIAAAEDFYARHGAAPRFQIFPEAQPELDAALAARGYRAERATVAMSAGLPAAPPSGGGAAFGARPGPDWFELWWAVDGRGAPAQRAAARAILTGCPAWYGALDEAAVVRAVPQADRLGIYCLAVAPERRGRGYARELLAAALDRGAAHGCREAYLMVTESNSAAIRLYRSAGFEPRGRYHYRVGPAGGAGAQTAAAPRGGRRPKPSV
ncbi:GNAT family N-acetyltransferase [Allonocardiopsis opalescens]|uniref:Acetyltransferase (GNAT) family protein n=1 Tax=Allonocardiopsis opalescens TaxID=1144618 RepID=A0A2T0Q0N3_9ACTN|nr:N-acetyltransferase [Allonocardiopsis opalescens]PRX97349.1 acetyltransferase (GNAT) family protein [Allonocardiopsis opalescens]